MERIYPAIQEVESFRQRVKKADQVRQRLGHAALHLIKLAERCGSDLNERTKCEADVAAKRFVQADLLYQKSVIACNKAVSHLSFLRFQLELLNGDFGHDCE